MSERTFAMHQPNYLPWLGWFDKLDRADVFVLLDEVQYPRGRSFASRNRIKTPNGPTWLTVPVSVPSGRKGKAAYSEIRTANDEWLDRHLQTITQNHARAPFTDEVVTLLDGTVRPLLDAADDGQARLVDVNTALIAAIADRLGISTQLVNMSDVEGPLGQRNELIRDLAHAIECPVYLSGDGGGREYNDEDFLSAAGVSVTYQEFTHPVYDQQWGEFEPGMAVIDLLCNHGDDAGSILRSART